MDDWTLTLCGRVALTHAGDPSPAPILGAKALALLAYLALEPRAHSREEITALLWGEVGDEKARASLRQTLRQIRTVLVDRIRTDRSVVELTSPISCDVVEFLRHAESDPAAAVRVDVPHCLEGLALRHCDRFEEWAADTRESLRHRYTLALATLGRDALARRDWRAASDAAKQWSAVEPLAEPMVRLAIEAYYMAGDHSSARSAFAAYEERLRVESGREPGSAVRHLLQQVELSANAPPQHAPVSASTAPPPLDAPLLGRTDEWRRLRTAWERARGGRQAIVLVEGEAGTGKTRLTSDFARWISPNGTVLRAHASDASSRIPLAPIIELLKPIADATGVAGADPQWIAEVARLVPALAQRFPGAATGQTSTPIDRWRLFEGVTQLLIAVAEETPLALLVEDLHCWDADSCALLHFLVQRLESSAVLWCVTLTLGVTDREDTAVRLERALRAEATVLVLQPFREDELRELVQGLGRLRDADSGERFARRLQRATAGNPFYVTEMLKTMFADGWLRADPVSGEWCGPPGWTDEAPFPPHQRLHRATAQRIGSLPEDQREILITLAVADGPCSTALLSHVHGISRLRAAATADALVERHLAVEAGGSYWCQKPIIAHVVQGELTTARHREAHRAIAFALEQIGESEMTSPDDIVRHAEQAGEYSLAHRYGLAATAVLPSRSGEVLSRNL